MTISTTETVRSALFRVLKDKRNWWSPSDVEDNKALRRIINDPHLLQRITEELNR